MRIVAVGDGLLEKLALRLNRVPVPAGYALIGQSSARVVGVAQRLGVYRRLCAGPLTAEALAEDLGLQASGTRLLCACLVALGVLDERHGSLKLSRSARRWLDPQSPTYIGTWLEHSTTYWEWYGDLERVVREGGSFEIHRESPEDTHYWDVYITGQYELARLTAGEVARALRLPAAPTHLLDLAGGHGWYAAAVCQRHAGLQATVVDLPGSVRVGRRIITEAGLSERVTHLEGDMLASDLGGPYDAALLFGILHHLGVVEMEVLLRRVRAVLRPGATLAVLDFFQDQRGDSSAMGATLGLFFHLTTAADLPDARVLAQTLQRAGFAAPRSTRLRGLPGQMLLQARALR